MADIFIQHQLLFYQ